MAGMTVRVLRRHKWSSARVIVIVVMIAGVSLGVVRMGMTVVVSAM